MRTNKKIKIIVFSLAAIAVLGIAFFAFAKDLEVEYPLFPGGPELTEKSTLTDYIAYVFNFVIFVSGFIILGVLIWSGILYLLSAGDPERQRLARSRIFAGFIGIIIILGSYMLLTTINPNLVMVHITREGIKITEPGEEPKIEEPESEEITLFQVPPGIIVERITSNDTASEFLGTSEELNENSVTAVAQETKELSRRLVERTLALRYHINHCDCKKPICPGCIPMAISCEISADCFEIEPVARELVEVANELAGRAVQLKMNEYILRNKIAEIKKPAFLMSLMSQQPEGITDYKTMLTNRHFLEEADHEVSFQTFEDWKDPGEDSSLESIGDNSFFMDIRTGFESRQELPPTFDPATFYFDYSKNNKKAREFVEKSNIIKQSIVLPDFNRLMERAMENGIQASIAQFLQKELSVSQDLENEDVSVFGKKMVEDFKTSLEERFGINSLKGLTGKRGLTEKMSKELSEKIRAALNTKPLKELGIDDLANLGEEINNWYQDIAVELNINIPEDFANEFTQNLIREFNLSCDWFNNSLEQVFRDSGITSIRELANELSKTPEQLVNELESRLQIEIESLDDLFTSITDNILDDLGLTDINIPDLDIDDLEDYLEDRGFETLEKLYEELANRSSTTLIIELELGDIGLPFDLNNAIENTLNEFSSLPEINSLDDLLEESLGIQTNGLVGDLFGDLGIYTIDDFVQRVIENPNDFEMVLTGLEQRGIDNLNDLVNDVAWDLTDGLISDLDVSRLDELGLDIIGQLNDRLADDIYDALIMSDDSVLGGLIDELPAQLGLDISDTLYELLRTENWGSLDHLLEDSLDNFVLDLTDLGFEQLGVYDMLDFGENLIENFEYRLGIDFGIDNLLDLSDLLAGDLTDNLIAQLQNRSFETILDLVESTFGLDELGNLSSLLTKGLDSLSLNGLGDIFSDIGIDLPGLDELGLPIDDILGELNVFSLVEDFEGALTTLGIETFEGFWNNIGGELNNLLLDDFGFLLPEGLDFANFGNLYDIINEPFKLLDGVIGDLTDNLIGSLSDQIAALGLGDVLGNVFDILSLDSLVIDISGLSFGGLDFGFNIGIDLPFSLF